VEATFSLSAKLEATLGVSVELEVGPKVELALDKTGLHVKEDEVGALETKLTALMDSNTAVLAHAVMALDSQVAAGMTDVAVALNSGGAEMQDIAAKIKTGFNIHL
jgi:hypothetical protein